METLDFYFKKMNQLFESKFLRTSRLICLVFIVLSLISCEKILALENQSSLQPELQSEIPGTQSSNFRVVGYLNGSVDSWDRDMDSAPLNQLTDIIFAFINPIFNPTTKNVEFILTQQQKDNMYSAVSKAINGNLRVYLSIGGGEGSKLWKDLIKPSKIRDDIISNLQNLVTDYKFDGIDVDLENELMTPDYSDFIIALSDSFRPSNKLVTAALADYSVREKKVTDAALQRFDFINIMAYDFKQPHSNFNRSIKAYQFFRSKNIPESRLVLGVPAYAVGKNGNQTTWKTYEEIIAYDPIAYTVNSLDYKKITYHYDGHPAIRKKVEYLLYQRAAGIMMWQIMGDTKDDVSLLRLINNCKTICIYEDKKQKGYDLCLPVGRYTQTQLEQRGFINNNTSSISVSPGLVAKVYKKGNLTGLHRSYTSDADFEEPFNNNVSSIIVTHADAVTVYSNHNKNVVHDQNGTFTEGYAIRLPVGEFTSEDLNSWGIKDNDIASLDIPVGFTVTLYENNNYKGWSKVYSASTNLWSKYLNQASSIKIKYVNAKDEFVHIRSLNGNGDYCLDAKSSEATTNGGMVGIWPCVSNSDAQKWKYDDKGRFVNKLSGKCMIVRWDQQTTLGAPVVVWDCNDIGNQKWTLGHTDHNIVHNKGLCLDIPNGTNEIEKQVIIYTCHDNANQGWYFDKY